jgi:hypothetical protein
VIAAASVATAALLVTMCYMGPILFYDDLIIKKEIISELFRTVDSGYMTPLLSVLSLRDIPFDWARNFTEFSKFQAGLIVSASLVVFTGYRIGRGGTYFFPFVCVSLLIMVFVVFPSVFSFPVLKSLDMAQFSYRFLGLFTLAGAITGALALKSFFASQPGFVSALRSVTFIVLTSFTIAVASPYLYPKGFPDSRVWHLGAEEISGLGRLVSNDTNYMRPIPQDWEGWIEPERLTLPAERGRPGDLVFLSELADYRDRYGGSAGEVLLDVLYYPGLQEVEVTVDGLPADLELGTFWQRRTSVHQNDSPFPGGFHGLMITDAPAEGKLMVRVKFSGMRWANFVSVFTLAFLFIGLVATFFKSRIRQKIYRQNTNISVVN